MVKKTLLCVSFSLALLAFLPQRARAQIPGLVTKPPCERGAIYVGGSRTDDAYCIDRRYQKMQKAQQWPEREMARWKTQERTRRSMAEKVRTVRLHPNVRRVRERGGYPIESALGRKHDVPMTEFQLNLRYLRRGARGQSPAETRQDRSPFTRWTRRSKAEAFRGTLEQRVEERGAFRERSLRGYLPE